MSGNDYKRLPDDDYKKLVFQLRGQFAGILNVFKCYGLDTYVDIAVGECVRVAENFGMAVRGKKKPIHIISEPKKRATE